MDERTPLTVSQVTALVRDALGRSPHLEDTLVEGEISNLSTPVSGHVYFTLKDSGASLRCVAFRTNAQRIPFRPENGMRVIAHGRLDVYDQGGTYQLYLDRLDPSGLGALALAVEQTRRRLAADGLMNDGLKRPLPLLPRRIVVVTSRTGAAWRDVCTVCHRRAPGIGIVLSPAVVQGENAADVIVTALRRASEVSQADVILLVRGGGSLEDLMAFNEERVARAIRSCALPVVTGIGHETDQTIADLVADRRAPTPSAAAELAVPVISELRAGVRTRQARLGVAAAAVIGHRRAEAGRLVARLDRASPARRLPGYRQTLDGRVVRLRSALLAELAIKRRVLDRAAARLDAGSPRGDVPRRRDGLGRRRERLVAGVDRLLRGHRTELNSRRARLEALSPRRILERGFSITFDRDTGKLVTDAGTAHRDQPLRTVLAHGAVESQVTAVEENGG